MTLMSLRVESSSCFNLNYKIIGDHQDIGLVDSSSVSSSVNSDDLSDDLLSEENDDEVSSPLATSSSEDPLQDMSTLMEQLPIKRGLSQYFQGKSQSFTSLANVRGLEDLPKPENPLNKKLKSCKSYALLSSHQHNNNNSHFPRTCSSSRLISKRNFSIRRNTSFLGNSHRPPVPLGL